jgi:hypothetical protein
MSERNDGVIELRQAQPSRNTVLRKKSPHGGLFDSVVPW